MTTDPRLAAPCGLYCADCDHFGDPCAGCAAVRGKPFWVSAFKVPTCPIYGCCVGGRNLDHCGQCDELPCDTFRKLRDPSLGDVEFERSLQDRIEILRSRS